LLARNPARSFTLSEIARRLLLNKATAHALLNTMAGVGLLERHTDFTFSLGREMIALGQAALSRHRVVGFARQEAATIAAQTRMNCTVSIYSGEHIVIVGNSGPLPEVGSAATPLVPPFGSVFLAWSKEEEVEAWLARAGNISEAARETLLSALDGVRKLGFHMTRPIDRMGLFLEFARIDGYADDRGLARSVRKVMGDLSKNAPYTLTQFQKDEATLPELIAVPAFGPDEDVALALTISGFSCPLTAEQVFDYVRILRSSCDRITALGGGRLPASFPDMAELRP
jgi:DNA-binding IclR family transcriptional regulator